MEYVALMFLEFVVMFFRGNAVIIAAVLRGDAIVWSENWFSVFIAVVVDLILLCLIFLKIFFSLRLTRRGIRNRRNAKRESVKIEKSLESINSDINRLEELRKKEISGKATKRTFHFCRLMEIIASKEQLQDCLSKVSERQGVLGEIDAIENKIFKIAESCKNADDVEKCKYYLNILKSTKITPEIVSLEKECEERRSLREKERKAIRLWKTVFSGVLIILIVFFVRLYIVDTPYREMRSIIKDQSLTAEMCSWENRNSEESYYDFFRSEKGCELLASELTKLHRADDVGKAMWLLSIQPNSINGYDMWASPSFITWIVEYAKNNGVRSVKERVNDWDLVTYSIEGYQVIIDSYDDKRTDISGISDFTISDGENQTIVYNWRRQSDNTPEIK